MRALSMQVSGGSIEPRRVEAGAKDATLGRAPDCTLVLPDEQRVISRVQARIEWRGGECVLVDLGSNPTLVNGRMLDGSGNGSREAVLRTGDSLRIGVYTVVVMIESDAVDDAPYEMPGGAWTEPRQASSWRGTQEDAPLIPPLIPTNWDADWKAGPNAPAAAKAAKAAIVTNAPVAPDSPFLDDPLAATPLLRDPPARGADVSQDLLAALGSGMQPLSQPLSQPLGLDAGLDAELAPRSPAGSAFEHISPERMASVLPQPMLPPESLIPHDYDALAAATMGGDAQDRPIPDAPEVKAEAPEPEPIPVAPQPKPQPEPTSPEPLPAAMNPAPEAPAQTDANANADPVFTALLQGLGLDAAHFTHFTQHTKPELARVIGSMLREATQGTMTALRSRSVAKHESRIAMTLIEPRDNNPLKFFPDVDTALAQMLGRPNAAYLAPEAAMRAAFRDLQGHDLAVVAGMRAALGEALADIAPERIEASLRPVSRVEGLLVSHRARLWQQFVDTYEHALRHAGDDFQQTFGESFNRAYHAQLSAMSQAGDD